MAILPTVTKQSEHFRLLKKERVHRISRDNSESC
ncbi:hypothetical protein CCACVL1_27104 [Corchorus capsularis]|uniref:Uncharacterized protein n=1 Tax=Corchorus capsularis TaxID=210143 RepID=A0A1R3GC75_COCAP|nr:hypothetical protein CCACVL1_27104 [Corchorus capsularis]